MAFLSLSAEAKSLAHAIHKFQHNISNKKAFHIDSALQEFINRLAVTELLNSSLLDVLKKKTRVAISTSSCFYNFSWLTDADKFPEVVARFLEIIINSQVMDSFF